MLVTSIISEPGSARRYDCETADQNGDSPRASIERRHPPRGGEVSVVSVDVSVAAAYRGGELVAAIERDVRRGGVTKPGMHRRRREETAAAWGNQV